MTTFQSDLCRRRDCWFIVRMYPNVASALFNSTEIHLPWLMKLACYVCCLRWCCYDRNSMENMSGREMWYLYPKNLPTIKRYSVAMRETFDFSHHTFKTIWSDGKQFKDIDRILAKRWHVECGTNSNCMHRYLIHVEDSSATKIFLRGLARETFLWRQNGVGTR